MPRDIHPTGGTQSLVDSLEGVEGLRESFAGKVVVGVSAGAYAVSESYLKVNDDGEIELKKGLGLLPLTTVTHYGSDFYVNKHPGVFKWELVNDLLADNGHNKVLKLKEGEYTVFNFSKN